MVKIGAHVSPGNVVAEAQARGADIVQVFLGNPQSWSAPTFSHAGGAAGMKQALLAAGIDAYVHAPYLINIPTTNNKVRIPSRKALQQTVDAAFEIGAKGVVVHGGHVPKEDDPELLHLAVPRSQLLHLMAELQTSPYLRSGLRLLQ